jgi:hypothetical protein
MKQGVRKKTNAIGIAHAHVELHAFVGRCKFARHIDGFILSGIVDEQALASEPDKGPHRRLV